MHHEMHLQHLAMLDERRRDIEATQKCLVDPLRRLPAPVRWIASLIGARDQLEMGLRRVLQARLARLYRERRAIQEVLALLVEKKSDQ